MSRRGRSDFTFELDLDKLLTRDAKYLAMFDYAGAVERGVQSGMKQVAKRTADKIAEGLVKYGLTDKGIANDIFVTIHDNAVSITVNNDFYMFIEFGTGIVGKNGPTHSFIKNHGHPWVFDSKGHGESGWWYPSGSDDPNPTLEMDSEGVWWAWTKGQESRPFMHDAWLYASKASVVTVDNHIAGELQKLEAMNG